ncbi:stage III sporulation protein AF [Pallidibacillus thermolactis]|jgi:stage III sporulation protein AF|uniref:stage III sporulation protein AF n=1 Tax=Pallidibacillus thermolactis TaxID=251051 RepID=UPI0021D84FE4|nr:stage III sporulation protein AF [Pallidibacillus thermolactis]MCU9600323.1 stage III sporulation protein AF [Pallidibacillus thermolactis subsp. kokeshiiformis]
MDFLTDWITNILLFILLAVVVELLLPQTSLQKYVKMVIGLLLISIILNPIFKLFSSDLEDLLKNANVLFEKDVNTNIENSIENQKVDIQADQNAYILEQTAVQLVEMTEKELMDTFNYQFRNVELVVDENYRSYLQPEDVMENLSSIQVSLQEAAEEKPVVKQVDEVRINLSEPYETEFKLDIEPIARFLADKWEVDKELLAISFERGQNENE